MHVWPGTILSSLSARVAHCLNLQGGSCLTSRKFFFFLNSFPADFVRARAGARERTRPRLQLLRLDQTAVEQQSCKTELFLCLLFNPISNWEKLRGKKSLVIFALLQHYCRNLTPTEDECKINTAAQHLQWSNAPDIAIQCTTHQANTKPIPGHTAAACCPVF